MLNIQKDNEKLMIISYFNISEENYKKIRKREWDYDELEVDIYNLNQEVI
jgi:hypothetical protein